MIRILAFLCLIVIALMMPVWAFVIAAVGYACMFGLYEILVLAVLVDARFGDAARGFSYMYTLLSAVIVLAVRFIRPRLQL
jgi:hypothetical protein